MLPTSAKFPNKESERMTDVIGVIGGIGSGKSAVSRAFAKWGAMVLDADRMAHEVMGRKETKDALRQTFGASIFDRDNNLDRQALSSLVFGSDRQEALERLNKIVHPAVRIELGNQLAALRAQGAGLVILDIPLLLGSPFREECDHILFVKVDRAQRIKRVQARSWSSEELDRRESSQLSLAEKEEAADLCIENNGSLEELELKVKKLYDQLVQG